MTATTPAQGLSTCDSVPGTTEYAMVVYRYGCPHSEDLTEAGFTQLRLANRLWNALVEIQKGHEEKVAAIWAEHPAVADAQAVVDEAVHHVEQAAGVPIADLIADTGQGDPGHPSSRAGSRGPGVVPRPDVRL